MPAVLVVRGHQLSSDVRATPDEGGMNFPPESGRVRQPSVARIARGRGLIFILVMGLM
jgi:hypothetical protein